MMHSMISFLRNFPGAGEVLAVLLCLMLATGVQAAAPAFRPPAVPLVTHDPYFSIWSAADRLTDAWPTHWTGTPQAMSGMVRIDGKPHRFLGPQPGGTPDAPAMEQTSLRVLPTRTIATFRAGGIELCVTFCSPLLPQQLEVLARPVTYVTTDVRSTDGKPHTVQVYLDLSAEVAVHSTDQQVSCEQLELVAPSNDRSDEAPRAMLRVGTSEQHTLGRPGDRVRIDWGHAYLAGDSTPTHATFGSAAEVRGQFIRDGSLPAAGTIQNRKVSDGWPVLAVSYDIPAAETAGGQFADRHFLLAYDEDQVVEYLGKQLLPYWRKDIPNAHALLRQASLDYQRVMSACEAFDAQVMKDLVEAGGEKYAQLAALAYRQAMAGHGLALSQDGRPFMFAKENSSNGCIGTVDVIYPAAPIFLLFSPILMEANLAPVIEYADSPRWRFDFAPHDLGTYPLANGQVYGGGEKTAQNQMPVEETANLLILLAAMERATGEPSQLVARHMPLLHKWARFLQSAGLDPENQLCTDDFTGHLAHNVNLSAKAIVGIAAFARICRAHGEESAGAALEKVAREMARQWQEMAVEGDHTRLAFDKPGTWSQKYNLVWDRVLGLKLFDPALLEAEAACYSEKSNAYGPPLDHRDGFAKVDWTLWSACLSSTKENFKALVDPLWRFANETPDRVPLTDWYQTDSAKNMSFQARPVVGGLYMKMLCDERAWERWARDTRTR